MSGDPSTWTCRHCRHVGIRIEMRLETAPLGSFSLAGAQAKVTAREWPYAVCEGCGHVSRGGVATTDKETR